MKKFILSFITLTTLSTCAFAQQDPQYTQWQFDRQSVNPASVGMTKRHCISIFHRDQWDGLDQDPKTYLLNYRGYFGQKENIGAGLTAYTEVLGQQQNNIVRLSGAYHISLSNNNFFSAGLNLGLIQSKLGNKWVPIDQNDPIIPTGEVSQGKFDLGLGTMLYQPSKYYVGLSVTHLLGGSMDALHMELARHIYVMGGVELPVGTSLVLRPNALVKTDLGATQLDVNADVLWNDMLWGGLSFRPGDAISPYVGFQKELASTGNLSHGIKIGYSYDVTTSELKDYSAGSHEVFATYCWRIAPQLIRARHSNPRFL